MPLIGQNIASAIHGIYTSSLSMSCLLSPPGKKKQGREFGSYSREVKTNEGGVEDKAPRPPDMNPVINATTVSTDMSLISSSLAAFNYIAGTAKFTMLLQHRKHSVHATYTFIAGSTFKQRYSNIA